MLNMIWRNVYRWLTLPLIYFDITILTILFRNHQKKSSVHRSIAITGERITSQYSPVGIQAPMDLIYQAHIQTLCHSCPLSQMRNFTGAIAGNTAHVVSRLTGYTEYADAQLTVSGRSCSITHSNRCGTIFRMCGYKG